MSTDETATVQEFAMTTHSGHNWSSIDDDDDPLADDTVHSELSRGHLKLSVPKGWSHSRTKERSESKTENYVLYSPREDDSVMFWYYFRGTKVNQRTAQNFRRILEQPAHSLSPKELTSINTVMRDKAKLENFRTLFARTREFNGKMVLVVEGRYVDDEQDAITIYIDADGTGQTVEELHYRAPKEHYMCYLRAVKSAFQSIEWK